jgi:hypothetical protein
VDDCVAIGSRRELESLAKYGITGLGEVKFVLGMLLERDRPAHDINLAAGGIHGLYHSLIQPHRCDHSLDRRPSHLELYSGLPHLEGRDTGNEYASIQRACRCTRVAKYRVGNMCAASSRDHARRTLPSVIMCPASVGSRKIVILACSQQDSIDSVCYTVSFNMTGPSP